MLRTWMLGLLMASLVLGSSALDPELEEAMRNNRDPEAEARRFIQTLDKEYADMLNKVSLAEWAYASNITDENLQNKLNVSTYAAAFRKDRWHQTVKFPWQTFKDPDLYRRFKKFSVLGQAALPAEKYEKLDMLVSNMESIYSKAKICDYHNQTKCDLSLEPELVELLMRSRDPKELEHVWVEWRRASGEKCRGLFERYVALSNEAAALNNFTDTSQFWLRGYEADDFQDQVQKLWEQLRPLYEQLHAYVRRRLRENYGEEVVSKDGPIPAHLLGNTWAQSWQFALENSQLFPDRPPVDVSAELVAQDYTPLRMFRLSEEFFTSINMSAMPQSFWEKSVLSKPEGRDLICHASAWDFSDGKDFRIKQCTRVNMADLVTAHHEMGHVEYFMQYKDQPAVYQEGANPGFHEAVGDVIALSVLTPKHLHKIGLRKESGEEDKEATLNFLFLLGLQKIAFLPYAYLMDLWRWDVFKGRITSDEYNCRWWKLRHEYQGIEPPVDRTEEDFDPGAKYHIIASVPYIRYFVSFVIQFQFHRALCIEAGEYDPNDPAKPLHNCDIYQSTAAGNKLKRMLAMGSSRPWPEAMEQVTGTRNMDASGLLEYFKPLHDWLKEENEKTGERIGWEHTNKVCVSTRAELENLRSKPQPELRRR